MNVSGAYFLTSISRSWGYTNKGTGKGMISTVGLG